MTLKKKSTILIIVLGSNGSEKVRSLLLKELYKDENNEFIVEHIFLKKLYNKITYIIEEYKNYKNIL